MAQNTLLVIFHGSMAFYDPRGDTILVRITDMAAAHEYLAGSFGNLRQIGRNFNLALSHVNYGTAPFDASKHCIFGQAKPSGTPYATLTFPRPDFIRYLFQADVDKDGMTGVPLNTPDGTGTRFSYITVFEYTYDESSTLPKFGEAGTPLLWTAKGDNGETLHIYAENRNKRMNGDHSHGHETHGHDTHVMEAFNETAKLLGKDAKLLDPEKVLAASTQNEIPLLLAGRHEEFAPLPFFGKSLEPPKGTYSNQGVIQLLKIFFGVAQAPFRSDDPSCLNVGGTP